MTMTITMMYTCTEGWCCGHQGWRWRRHHYHKGSFDPGRGWWRGLFRVVWLLRVRMYAWFCLFVGWLGCLFVCLLVGLLVGWLVCLFVFWSERRVAIHLACFAVAWHGTWNIPVHESETVLALPIPMAWTFACWCFVRNVFAHHLVCSDRVWNWQFIYSSRLLVTSRPVK